MVTYRIVRFKRGYPNRTIKRGLSLEDAQAHCSREDTHKLDKQSGNVIWFDGYEKE